MANNTSLYGSNGNVLPAGDNVIITGTLTVNGCAILTDCSAFNFLPFNANTLNIGLESTTLALGSTTGVTTVRNQLATNNYAFPVADGSANQVLITDGSGNLSFASVGSLGVVTSITGTANQVIASSPTGAVTLSLPQDIATTSGPQFASVTGGNIIVGGLTDNTISSANTNGDIILQPNGNGDVSIAADTLFIGDGGANAFITTNGVGTLYINTNNGTNTGSLFIESGVNGNIVLEPFAGGTGAVKTYNDFVVDDDVFFVDVSTKRIGINNPTPLYELHIDQGLDGLTQFAMTTNERTALLTMNDGDDLLSLSYGPVFATNRLQFSPTDQWFNLGRLGVGTNAPAYELDVSGSGRFTSNLIASSSFTLNGATSGYSNFVQPAVAANIGYTLPTSQGAASTVLTNDGSGNLSWALPGGGGSTFGNITVAVVTDNTISTTTGDLVLASATNLIDASTAEVNVNVLTVDNRSSIETTLLTTTSVATIPIAGTVRNVMKCVISVVDNVTGERQALEALALEKGTTAYLTTYAEMNSGVVLATFSADVSAGTLRVLATPTSTNSTTFNVVRTSLN
jgi:hypothetical protein